MIREKVRMAVRIVFVMSMAVCLVAGVAQQESVAADKPIMAMVTNQSGLGDQAFNDATWAGFLLWLRKNWELSQRFL